MSGRETRPWVGTTPQEASLTCNKDPITNSLITCTCSRSTPSRYLWSRVRRSGSERSYSNAHDNTWFPTSPSSSAHYHHDTVFVFQPSIIPLIVRRWYRGSRVNAIQKVSIFCLPVIIVNRKRLTALILAYEFFSVNDAKDSIEHLDVSYFTSGNRLKTRAGV